MTDNILNEKIERGLRAQYNPERVSAILQQAQALYQESQWRSGNRNPTSAEAYELLESGWIDRALEFLAYGKWAIGRPKIGNGNGSQRKPGLNHNSRARAKPEPLTPEPTQNHFPLLSEIFTTHLPNEFPQSRGFGDNAIEFRNVLVIGGQGSGKTTVVRRLAQTLADKYGQSNVRAYLQTAGIDGLLSGGTKLPSPVRLLAAEDMTLREIPRDTLNSWFQVRHLVARHTGWRHGLVIASSNVHTLFGLEKNLRTDFALMILLTIPTNPYDRSLLKRYFDPDLLAQFERKAKKGDALVWDRYHSTGAWAKVDYPTENLLTEFQVRPINSNWDIRWAYSVLAGFGAILAWALYKFVEVGIKVLSHA